MRPSEHMRSRRPYLFSDSEIVSTPTLTRELLDHQLETLTNRKEENEFEHLCRRLAEKEICPNLRPQTGPTGGGDAKVDSETYPVSIEIAQSWYEGEEAAAHEMWAFAFSAKRDWRAKVRSDVKSIKSTGRPYRRIRASLDRPLNCGSPHRLSVLSLLVPGVLTRCATMMGSGASELADR